MQREDWVVRFAERLLRAEPTVLDLLAHDPFAGRAPRAIRVRFFRYQLLPPGSQQPWSREEVGLLLRPITLEDEDLALFFRQRGWPLSAP